MHPRWRSLCCGAVSGFILSLAACTSSPPAPTAPPITDAVYRRAATARTDRLEREVERLRDDLRRAEEALVSVESGLRERHGRADAVSSLAQARIEVERAAEDAPWQAGDMAEAWVKLDEAELQIREEHFGAALFFVYRASRMAALVSEEALQARNFPGTRFVSGARVNLRAGPSTDDQVLTVLPHGTPVFPEAEQDVWVLVRTATGPVGWIHGALLH